MSDNINCKVIPPAVEESGVKARVITPDDGGHYFFGYYDLQPFDSTGRYHLCHKAPFEDRLPEADDICELGVIDLQTGKFIKYAETNAWNFQQGMMISSYVAKSFLINYTLKQLLQAAKNMQRCFFYHIVRLWLPINLQ